MNKQDERLQRAWLALCGWRRVEKLRDRLPALDYPGNWGMWLAWTADTLGSVELRRSEKWWSAASVHTFTWEHETPAAALMEIYCRRTAEVKWPQEVREWWEHKEREEDGEK